MIFQELDKRAKKRPKVVPLLARKLMLSIVTVCLLVKPDLLFSFEANSETVANSGRIEYVVDVRQASKRILLIKAQIYGFAGSEVTFEFSNPKRKNAEIAQRVSGLSLRRANAGTIKIREAQLSFETNADDTVEVSYQFKSDVLSNLDKATY